MDTSEDKVGVQKFAVMLWNTSSGVDQSLGSDSLSTASVCGLQGCRVPLWGCSIYAVAPHSRTLEDMSRLFSGRPVIRKGHVWQEKEKSDCHLGNIVVVISSQSLHLSFWFVQKFLEILIYLRISVVSYQTDWMRKAVLKPVFLEQLPEVGDVAGRKPERVQFRQFGVGRNPGQAGLQPGEGFAQHPHSRSLSGVGRVPLRLTRVPVRRPGDPALLLDPPLLRAVIVQLLIRVPAGVVAGDFARRPLQGAGGGRSSGTRLVVLGVARSGAGGHVASSTCSCRGAHRWPFGNSGPPKTLRSVTDLEHEPLRAAQSEAPPDDSWSCWRSGLKTGASWKSETSLFPLLPLKFKNPGLGICAVFFFFLSFSPPTFTPNHSDPIKPQLFLYFYFKSSFEWALFLFFFKNKCRNRDR